MYHRVASACEKADPEHRKSQDWSFNGPDGRLRPACDKSPSRQGQGLCRSRHARKEQRFLSTVSISRCKAIRTAFTWAGACLTKSSRGCASIGKKSSARCFRCCDFHPRRRYGARFRLQGSGWHGRHQCPNPGATRLLHVWWLETLGVWRSQSARPGRGVFLYQDQDRELPLVERCEGRGELCHPYDDVGRGFIPYRYFAGEVCNLALAKYSVPASDQIAIREVARAFASRKAGPVLVGR